MSRACAADTVDAFNPGVSVDSYHDVRHEPSWRSRDLVARAPQPPPRERRLNPADMPRIIVFDVNETLLDINALEPHFVRVFNDARVLREWFSTVLLYSQVATLAGPYSDFSSIGAAALGMTAASRQRIIEKEIGRGHAPAHRTA